MLERVERALQKPELEREMRRGDERVRCAYPFAVDSHLHLRVDAKVRDLGDVLDFLHIRGITPGAEDARNTSLGVHVVRRDERARRVAREGNDLSGYLLHEARVSSGPVHNGITYMLHKRFTEHLDDVMALGI